MKSFNFVLLVMAFLLASPVVYASLQSKSQYISVVQAPDISAITAYDNSDRYKPFELASVRTLDLPSRTQTQSSSVTSNLVSSAISSSSTSKNTAPEIVATLELKPDKANVSSSNTLLAPKQNVKVEPINTQKSSVTPVIVISSSSKSVDSVVPVTAIQQEAEVPVEIKTEPVVIQSSSAQPVKKEAPVPVETPKPVTSEPVKDENFSGNTYHEKIDFYCVKFGCNPVQLKRVMNCESTNNMNARNGQYVGLFQFGPQTFNSFARSSGLVGGNIYNAEHQIYVAAWAFANGNAYHWSCK
jgi:hypothetical protein